MLPGTIPVTLPICKTSPGDINKIEARLKMTIEPHEEAKR
ncbi:MAG: hypothetical protein JWQ24_1901 [Tardiphaga sp.]|nr:hypothetical protein [Tardiphaga sp.]